MELDGYIPIVHYRRSERLLRRLARDAGKTSAERAWRLIMIVRLLLCIMLLFFTLLLLFGFFFRYDHNSIGK